MRTVPFFLLFLAAPALAGDPLIGKAHGEVAGCLADARNPGWEIVGSSQVTASCFAGGFLTTVQFHQAIKCSPNEVCPRVAARLVAEVAFGCDDEVLYGECLTEPDPEVCPMIYDPVCGVDGTTYGNACLAAVADVSVDYVGGCVEPVFCPAIYDPVCGVDGTTYSSSCYAGAAGVEVDYAGECAEPVVCTMHYAPVCGTDGNTYSNECVAKNAGAEVAHEGECGDGAVTF